MKIVCIEGNIGSGKTSIIRALSERYSNIHIVDEPIDIWSECKDVNNKTRFEIFKNGDCTAFEFQLYAQMTRVVRMNEKIEEFSNSDTILLVERSVESGNDVFGRQLIDQGCLSVKEHDEIVRICKNLKTWKEDVIIMLDTPVDVCIDRIKIRDRSGESEVSVDFLKQIRDLYYKNFVFDNLYKCLIKGGKKSTEAILDEYDYIFDNVFHNHIDQDEQP